MCHDFKCVKFIVSFDHTHDCNVDNFIVSSWLQHDLYHDFIVSRATNPLLSQIHVNTTYFLNITCTLIATCMILRTLECNRAEIQGMKTWMALMWDHFPAKSQAQESTRPGLRNQSLILISKVRLETTLHGLYFLTQYWTQAWRLFSQNRRIMHIYIYKKKTKCGHLRYGKKVMPH